MSKRVDIVIILFILSCYAISAPTLAQVTDQQKLEAINKQNQIIRLEQEAEQRAKRQREFDKIQKEREQLKKQEQEKTSEKSAKSDICFTIKQVELDGANSLSKKQKSEIKSPFLGKCFDGTTLTKLVQKTNSLYQNLGLVTTQVTLPKQNIASGNLKIEITEGKIEDIILGEAKFTDKMQKFTAFGLKKDKILDINDINQGIFQINRLSSNNAKMKIEPGKEAGYSKIIIDNNKDSPVAAKISYDNLGNDFTGVRRVNFSGTLDNLLFLNDQINLSHSTNLDDPSNEKDSRSFTGGISIPFTYNTISYKYSRTKYRGQNEGTNGPLILSGYSNSNNLAIDRTLLNNTEYRISTNLSLTAKETASYLNKTKIQTSARKLTIGSLSFSVSRYFKNGVILFLKPQYSRGLKLLNAKQDAQGLTADIPRAQFQLYKIYGSISQKFNIPKTKIPIAFTTEFDSQLSKNTLFGSEQFSVGGYYSVRGFRENNISGDYGYYIRNHVNLNLGKFIPTKWKLRKETETTYVGTRWLYFNNFNIEPFFDYGYVKSKYDGSSGRLSGVGIKTIFSGNKYFDASLTYACGINKSSLITSANQENKMLYFELARKILTNK